MFCCELASYSELKMCLIFSPSHLISSLSARRGCTPLPFGTFAKRRGPLQWSGSLLLVHRIGNNYRRADLQDCLLVFDHLGASCFNSCRIMLLSA